MRTEKEIAAEIEALKRPHVRMWPPPTATESAPLKAWETANPELAKLYADLMTEASRAAESEQAAEKARSEAAYSRKRLRATGLGERTVDLVLGGPESTPAIEAAREWSKADKCWLVLAGDVGTGKTCAGGLALMLELARGEAFVTDHSQTPRPRGTGAFRRAPEVVRMSAFDEGATELKRLKSVAMLVIDDLGTEHATSWGKSLIHEIFDARHEDRLRTVITTNIKREQLKAALGDRLADRIAQDGRVVHLEGKSMRRSP